MIYDKVLSYIKEQLAKGLTVGDIRKVLTEEGWQPTIVEENIQAVQADPEYSKYFIAKTAPTTRKKSSKPLIALGVLLLIVVVGGVAVYAYKHSSTQIAVAAYTDPGSSYKFRYPKSWTVKNQGTLTGVASPETTKNNPSKGLGFGDVLISATPYIAAPVALTPGVTIDLPATVAQSHGDQVKALATSLASGQSTTSTKVGKLSGYLATTLVEQEVTLNIILEGTTQSFMIQFPGVKELSSLTKEQKVILDSFEEVVGATPTASSVAAATPTPIPTPTATASTQSDDGIFGAYKDPVGTFDTWKTFTTDGHGVGKGFSFKYPRAYYVDDDNFTSFDPTSYFVSIGRFTKTMILGVGVRKNSKNETIEALLKPTYGGNLVVTNRSAINGNVAANFSGDVHAEVNRATRITTVTGTVILHDGYWYSFTNNSDEAKRFGSSTDAEVTEAASVFSQLIESVKFN